MSEERDENQNETELEAEFESQDVYNFLDCLTVIDTLTAYLLKWMQRLGTVSTPSFLALQKHLMAIAEHVKNMKRHIWEHTREVMGEPQLQKSQHRHSLLCGAVRRVLKGMRFF